MFLFLDWDNVYAVCWKFSTIVIQILKFQVGIFSLGALYCESIVKMKSPMDLWLLRSISSSKTSDMPESAHLIFEFLKCAVSHFEGTATGRFIRSCVSLWPEQFRLSISHFCETRDGKTCMSCVVFDTKNVDITNPKIWPRPRPMNWFYENLINCRDNEHYEQVEKTCWMFIQLDFKRKHQMRISDNNFNSISKQL